MSVIIKPSLEANLNFSPFILELFKKEKIIEAVLNQDISLLLKELECKKLQSNTEEILVFREWHPLLALFSKHAGLTARIAECLPKFDSNNSFTKYAFQFLTRAKERSASSGEDLVEYLSQNNYPPNSNIHFNVNEILSLIHI